jgi:hypothetical protein
VWAAVRQESAQAEQRDTDTVSVIAAKAVAATQGRATAYASAVCIQGAHAQAHNGAGLFAVRDLKSKRQAPKQPPSHNTPLFVNTPAPESSGSLTA